MKRMILRIAIGAMFIGSTAMLVQAQPAPGGAAPGGGAAAPGGAGRGAPGAPGGFPGARGGGRGQQFPVGDPAPVPDAVKMLRPSADELKTINDALKRFAQTDTSPAGAVLKKYESLLVVPPPPPLPNVAATYTNTNQRAGAHDAWVEIAKKGNIDLLLNGDSITDWWDQNDGNKAVFDKYFGQYKTANFGVAGDTTQGVLWGLKNGEGEGYQPKAIMLMIGTNNTGGNTTAGEIAEGVGAIVQDMRTRFPNAKILLLAIFPRGNPGEPVRAKIADINKTIAKLDDKKNIFYMDIGPKFLDATGAIPTDVMGDRLHPTAKGYEIWGEAVKDKIAELMK